MLIQQPSVLAVDRKVYVRNTIFIFIFFFTNEGDD